MQEEDDDGGGGDDDDDDDDDDGFYIARFSLVEQAYFVFHSTFRISTEMVYLQRCSVVACILLKSGHTRTD